MEIIYKVLEPGESVQVPQGSQVLQTVIEDGKFKIAIMAMSSKPKPSPRKKRPTVN